MTQQAWYTQIIMSHSHANATLQQAVFRDFELDSSPSVATDLLSLSLSSAVIVWLLLPKTFDLTQRVFLCRGIMSLAVVGAVIFALCAMAYVLSINSSTEEGLQDPKKFPAQKARYRRQRDHFRNNPEAMGELVEWKAMKNDCDYKEL